MSNEIYIVHMLTIIIKILTTHIHMYKHKYVFNYYFFDYFAKLQFTQQNIKYRHFSCAGIMRPQLCMYIYIYVCANENSADKPPK